MITRLTKLDDFQNILAGRDLAGVFEEGHVYSAVKILDQIILTDLGEHAKMENYKRKTFTSIIMDGTYCFTKEEYQKRLQLKDGVDTE